MNEAKKIEQLHLALDTVCQATGYARAIKTMMTGLCALALEDNHLTDETMAIFKRASYVLAWLEARLVMLKELETIKDLDTLKLAGDTHHESPNAGPIFH